MMANWTLVAWGLSLGFSIASCVFTWVLRRDGVSLCAPVFMTIYCAIVGAIVFVNAMILLARTAGGRQASSQASGQLHKIWGNPWARFLEDGLWPKPPATRRKRSQRMQV
jgi:hypothetical protein